MTADGTLWLIDGARSLLDGIDHPALGAFLTDWPAPDAARRPAGQRSLPVLGWLGALPAGANPGTHALVEQLVATAGDLAWGQTYRAGDIGGRFLDRYGWTELIGLRGPVASDRIACGFLLLGPDIEYPPHAHAAEEIYVPLAGTADWLRGDEGWRQRSPGAPIHHPSWIPHAMRTAGQPLLALYLWRGGDLAQKSTILPAGPESEEGGDDRT
jgi:hypothetical protein